VVGIASLRQYYTPVALNVYKQKTPRMWGFCFNPIP